LAELLKNPEASLTDDQLVNWHKYTAMTNDDISAEGVDITDAVEERIREIDAKGTVWR